MSNPLGLTGKLLAPFALLATLGQPLAADTAPQTLPLAQNWSNPSLITTDDDWSGVPGIQGFRGDGLTSSTGTDPQTILSGDDTSPVVDVNANRNDPDTFSTGGVTEFDGLANPTVALSGSGTADAPYLRLHLNTTGAANVRVAYALRDLDGSADNAVQAVALQFRVGSSGSFTNVPAGFVADATAGGTATKVSYVCAVLPAGAANQPVVQVRIMTSNAAGNDEWVGIDDLMVDDAPTCPLRAFLSDATVTEGDSGTVTASFTLQLSAPAPLGGVTFDIATQDGSATASSGDYDARALSGETIAEGVSSYLFDVTVHGDTAVEPDETFTVALANVTGAEVVDGTGLGTILNDDVATLAVHDVQGAGASSPYVGQPVVLTAIVTGVKSNGFFLQEEESDYDADPVTSEGVFVFTNSAPPAAAAVGNRVQVSGTVSEYVPSADPLQPPVTEIVSPSVVLQATGQSLPAPVPLTPTFPDSAGAHDQLERVEGMRVVASQLVVVGPTLGSVAEPTATATSTGVFFGVVPPLPRPFRETGIQAPDPPPQGTIPPIPRFDSNPERVRVDSDGLVGTSLIDVGSGALVSNVMGPLDYTFRTYTILPDPGAIPAPSGGPTPTAVSTPTTAEVTVAAFNLERFFDDVDDPAISEPVLTPTAYSNRLGKASLAIRDYLKAPDVLGVVECENISTLSTLAARISADAVAASEPDPAYAAYLVEGLDVGGIDVGFLVKTAPFPGAIPRVEVDSVTQYGAAATYVNPQTGLPELLNDRPPLALVATVHHASGETFPVTVIVNHLRSLNGINDETVSGSSTVGGRVRAKRLAQAEYLANLVQTMQTAQPAEPIVLVGDFNAFEVNDGFVHSMATIAGTPVPDDQTAVPGDGADLVNPDLSFVVENDPAARYSYVFDGNAQTLDHVLASAALLGATSARRAEHPRIDADFPESDRNDYSAGNPRRLSDHDPVVAFFAVPSFATTVFADGFESADTSHWSSTTP